MGEVVVAASFKVKDGSEGEAEEALREVAREPANTWFVEALAEGDPEKGALS